MSQERNEIEKSNEDTGLHFTVNLKVHLQKKL